MPYRHLQILQWDLKCMLKRNVMECLQDDASIQHLICNIIVEFLPIGASKLFPQPKCYYVHNYKFKRFG
jgi:hypothetical protein